MINPIDPGWVRINDALHKQDRRDRRRRRRNREEEDGEESVVTEREAVDEEAKVDLVV